MSRGVIENSTKRWHDWLHSTVAKTEEEEKKASCFVWRKANWFGSAQMFHSLRQQSAEVLSWWNWFFFPAEMEPSSIVFSGVIGMVTLSFLLSDRVFHKKE